ncbi:serine protease inhibitor 88Ea-like isoform X2 [Hermetia illucens]|nr:serine protease inhibitor 88Ea-like isoform X2 [Hermetia illucens]
MRVRILPLSCLIFLATTVHAALPTCLTENDSAQFPSKTDHLNLYSSEQAFTVSLLDAINKATPSENIFFSPYSTFHALLLAYFGSSQETEASLKNALRINWAQNKMQVMHAYRHEKQLRARAAKNSSIEFNSADKIYVSKETELRDCMKNVFNEELETKDFLQAPEESRNDINKWVEGVTRGHIKDILVPGTITQLTKLVLANAAYFKGSWSNKFNPDNTRKDVFYSSPDKQTFVDMMYKKGTFNHGLNERLGAHVLELPYEGEDPRMSMIIFLPPFDVNGVENVLSKLTPESLEQALNEGMPREIEIKLPKFSFEKSVEFRPVLERIGVGNIFEPSANFSGFSEKQNLNLDDAIHKAKIEVDEEGSTAAAATVLFSFRSSRPLEPAQFFCDHPFLFLIYDVQSRAILFAGIYRGPEK